MIVDLSLGLTLIALGAAAGVAGGLLGVGGGLVMIPGMLLLRGAADGPQAMHLYKLTATIAATVVVFPAALRHARARAVDGPALRWMLLGAIFGIVAGVWLAGLFRAGQTVWLERLLAGVMFITILGQLRRILSAWRQHAATRDDHAARAAIAAEEQRETRLAPGQSLLIGGPAGVLSGLLGIGGGIWAVPAQSWVGVPLRRAIGTSSAFLALSLPVTSAVQVVSLLQSIGEQPLRAVEYAAWLAPGALLGGWVGAGLTHRLPIVWVRIATIAIMAWAGGRLIW